MLFKCVGQFAKLFVSMVVADGVTSGLPNMLLRVQVRCAGWIVDDFEPLVVLENLLDGWSSVPWRPVPEEQDRHVRKGFEYTQQKQG